MPETRYQWDAGNLDHIAGHGVEDYEAEEALEDPKRVSHATYNRGIERRMSIIGATTTGRILRVIYTMRNQLIRVVTARDADKSEKRRYKR